MQTTGYTCCHLIIWHLQWNVHHSHCMPHFTMSTHELWNENLNKQANSDHERLLPTSHRPVCDLSFIYVSWYRVSRYRCEWPLQIVPCVLVSRVLYAFLDQTLQGICPNSFFRIYLQLSHMDTTYLIQSHTPYTQI